MDQTQDIEALLGGDVFAHLGEQTIEDLAACYKGGTWPASEILHGAFADRPVAWRVAAFGAAARRRIHLVDLRDALLGLDFAPDALPTPQLKTEYLWFLFSQRAWTHIARFVDGMTVAQRGHLEPHIADIYFLSFYRLQIDRIMAGQDQEGFLADARRVLSVVKTAWASATERLAAYQGMIDHIRGNFDVARATFTRIGLRDLISPLAALRNVFGKGASGQVERPEIVIRPAQRRIATLVSLDRVYFDRFARAFAERYDQLNRDKGLHFHCIGFDPQEEVNSWGLSLSIGVSIDPRDVSGLPPLERAGYYAGARYIYLPEYLRHYEAVYIADADGLVLRDIATIEADVEAADVAMATRNLEPNRTLFRLPWESISAGSLFVRSTPGGRLFGEAVSSYLETAAERAFADGAPLWFADQNALFYTSYDLRHEVRFQRFRKAAFAQENAWTLFESLDAKAEFIKRSKLPPR
ncbi:MAG: hypothetical protein AB7P20_15765 [Rhizobiaceae bacterium]